MSSKALIIAKKDFSDAARSKLLWGTVLALLVVAIPPYLSQMNGGILDTDEEAIRFLPLVFVNYVGPIAIISAHRAIVGERESGSLRVMLGLPTTRRDFLVGKAIGRSALVAVVLLVSTLGLGITVVATFGTLDVSRFAITAGYVVFYGIVWAGLTVGISAAVSSRLQAISAALGLFLVFGPFQIWDRLAVPMFSLAFTGSTSTAGIDPRRMSTWPTWYQYVQRLNPIQNFDLGRHFVRRLVDPSISASSIPTIDLFGIAVLLAWFVVPLAIGYWRFERVDLG